MTSFFELTPRGILIAVLLALAPLAIGQPSNDDFVNRMLVLEVPTTITGSNTLATLEVNEPTHLFSGRRSVWWSWTPPKSSRVAIDITAFGFSPVLEVYTGSALINLTVIASKSTFTTAPLVFDAIAGTAYQIAVTARGSQSPGGAFVLQILPPPVNDDFTNRTPLVGARVSVTSVNHSAGTETSEPSHVGLPSGASIWYTWTPAASGWVTLELLAAPFTARAAVYKGSSLSTLSFVSGETLDTGDRKVGFAASADTPYQIVLTSDETYAGKFAFALSLTTLAFASPTNGSVFDGPASVAVSITDPDQEIDGAVQSVRYSLIVGGYEVRSVSASLPPFDAFFTNLPPGRFILRGHASNDLGNIKEFAPVRFDVRPENDAFSNAIIAQGYEWSLSGSSVAATTEPGEPDHDNQPGGASVWSSWTAPANGVASFSCYSNFYPPAAVRAYTGTSVSNLVNVPLQSAGPDSYAFNASAGVTYHIAIDGPNDPGPLPFGLGGFHLALQLDTLFIAEPLDGASFTEPDNIQVAASTTEAEGRLLQVEFYSGTNLLGTANGAAFSLLWTNPPVGSHSLQARGTLNTGEVILSGIVHIAIRPSNDDFTNALAITGNNVVFGRNNAGATLEPDEPLHGPSIVGRSLWYLWRAPGSGRVELDQSGSQYKPTIGVHVGTILTNLALIASNRTGAELPGKAIFNVTEGIVYFIAVADYYDADVVVHLQLFQPPGNDHFTNRFHLAGSSLTVTGSTVLGTKEPGEPGNLSGSSSVWWSWKAPGPGAVKIRFGGDVVPWASFDGLYTGSTLATLVAVPRILDPFGQAAIFDVLPGVEYQIAFDSYRETDPLIVTIEHFPAPENDLFQHRSIVSGFSVNVTNSNLGASKELGEPEHPYGAGGHSVWWSWSAPANGHAYVTAGAYFRPLVAAYTGNTLSNLVRIAAADNGVGFQASAGTTYQIAVDGDLGRIHENFVLTLQLLIPPPNDYFANRITLTGPVVNASGYNREASTETSEPSHGQPFWVTGHSIWWSWVAPGSGPVTITGTSPQMQVVLAVYTGSSVSALTAVTNSFDSPINFQAVGGRTYQIAVDGYNGQTGDITVSLAGTMPPTIELGSTGPQADGRFRVRVSGLPGQNFALQTSPDLRSWTNLEVQSLTFAFHDFIDQSVTNFGRRFYRVVPQP